MPMGQLFAEDSSTDGGGDEKSRAQLFAELNKGEDVTRGLKKVTADMQTHKNPNLRSGPGPIPSAKPGIGPKPGSGPAAQFGKPADKPPRKELEGKKWMIEYQKNQTGIIIGETEMNQVVYVYKCEGSTIQVKGNNKKKFILNLIIKFLFLFQVKSIQSCWIRARRHRWCWIA